EDLGVKHRLWVYSGRRGVHCWVCDDAVRKWSPALRAAAVEYLSLVKALSRGGGEVLRGVRVGGPGHPGQPRELGQGAGAHPRGYPSRSGSAGSRGRVRTGGVGSAVSVTSLDPRAQHREPLQGDFPKKRDSAQRWELLKGRMERTRVSGCGAAPGEPGTAACCPLTRLSPQRVPGAGKSTPCYADWEIMLQYCFPRLDINVSKGIGHLLKSPFSVHPKTGRISVPLDLQRLDQFDPFAVPTISSLCHELDAAGDDGEQEDSGETEPKRRARDYKRTSLAPYVRVFEQFVEEMERARRGELLRRSGERRAG
ncbi:PRI1 primase, partial [Podargus strigoides]|nr:PRI1 primase [Podargus strigoides]